MQMNFAVFKVNLKVETREGWFISIYILGKVENIAGKINKQISCLRFMKLIQLKLETKEG